MKQIWIPKTGAPSVLELRDAPDPTPQADQVRIKVEASGVNFADLMARLGVYPDAPKLPAVVGYEVAGTIDRVGSEVDESMLHQRVLAVTQFGGYATHVVLPKSQVLVLPSELEIRRAAAIPVNGLTAWMMLEEMGRVRKSDRVLVHSAGGGVGLMALDLLKWRGATAIGLASTQKHDALYARGYDRLFPSDAQDNANNLAKEAPFDLILDPIGGASWAKSFELLRSGGRLVCFGFSKNVTGPQKKWMRIAQNMWDVPLRIFNPLTLLNANKGVLGVNMGRMWQETERLSEWLKQLLQLFGQGILRPHVSHAFPFSQASEAHQILHRRANLGKVVLVPDDIFVEDAHPAREYPDLP